VQAHLQTLGVSSRIYYPIPLHLQPVYQNLGYQAGDYPHSETCAHQVLSLPLFPELKRSQQEHVAAALHEAMDKTAIPHG
jgi:dTDP-4-amino-4,6-dideoxygalactose transaminase